VTCLDPLTRHSHAPLVGAPLDFTACAARLAVLSEFCAAVIDEANRSYASLICRNGDRTDLPTGVTRSFGVRRGQRERGRAVR
jgi:hypothetical protein